MKKLFVLMLVSVFVFSSLFAAQPARAAGKVYYVSVTGKDSNSGSLTRPFRTIQKAADVAVAGDTVYVRRGTYTERVTIKNSGAAGNYITFSAYPGETAIVDVKDIAMPSTYLGGFTIEDKNYIQVIGFRINNSTNGYGIVCRDTAYCVIKNNHTYNTLHSGIAVRTASNVTIDGNAVELANNDGAQEMISVADSQFVNVTHNHVYNGGPGTNGGEGIDIKDGSHDVLVHGNIIHDTPRIGIYVDAWLNHTYNITIDGNIVHHVVRSAIAVASERGGELNNVTISNNLVYQNERSGIVVGDWDAGYPHPIHHIYIVNNTVYGNGTGDWGGGIDILNPKSTDIFIRNNILSANSNFTIRVTDMPLSEATITNNLLDGFRNLNTEQRGTNFVEANPNFYNAALLDFHLRPASPAINAGTTSNAPDHDFANQARGAGVDIGAYEYDASAPVSFFRESFDSKFSGWAKTKHVTWYTGVPRIGAHSIRLAGKSAITRAISTRGYKNITLVIYLGAKSYEGAEKLTLSWWNGASWKTLAAIKNRSARENGKLNRMKFSLPTGANNRPDFKIRVSQSGADLADFGYVDSVQITGVIIP